MDRIPIWNEIIPYNTGAPKKEALNLDPALPWQQAMACVFGGVEATSTRNFDVAAWHNISEGHRSSEYFDDVPYLIPHVVPGSKICVLLCAGGAYLDVSTEDESAPVAQELNRHGITAFTLNYRVYPYTAPAMFLDCRRAICYLRAHADQYGFDPDKICIGGFSAGGNLVSTTTFLFEQLPAIEGYTPDEIDAVSAKPNALMMAYPKVIFTDSTDLLVPVLGSAYFEGDREEYARQYHIPNHMTKENTPPTFLVGSINDSLVDTNNLFAYASCCHQLGVPFEVHQFLEGGHGYGSARNRPYSPWAPPGDYRGTDTWTDLFAIWLEKIFSKPDQRVYR